MRISSWVWISVVAVGLLLSGLAGVVDGGVLLARVAGPQQAQGVEIVDNTVPAPLPAADPVPAPQPEMAIPVASTPIAPADPAPAAAAPSGAKAPLAPMPVEAATPNDWAPNASTINPPTAEATPAVATATAVASTPAVESPTVAVQPRPSVKKSGVRAVRPRIASSPNAPTAPAAMVDLANAPIVVELLPEVQVRGEHIYLSDVAKVRGHVGVALPAPNTVEVGKLDARSTHTVVISRPIVRQALVNEGVDMQSAVFTGANATRVVPERNVVQSHDLMAAAQTFLMRELTQRYGWNKADIHIRPVQNVPEMVVPSGRVVVVPSRTDERRPMGSVAISLEVKVDGRHFDTVRASFQVQVMGRVVVARNVINVGNVIAADDVELRSMDLASLPEGAVTKLSDVVGRMSNWTLRPGSVLAQGMAVTAPMVSKNAAVTIHYQGERVELTMSGVALKDGQKDDSIPVRNTDTGKVLEAVVVDRGNVMVAPPPTVSMLPVAAVPKAPPAPGSFMQQRAPMPMHGTSPNFSEQRLPPAPATMAPPLPPAVQAAVTPAKSTPYDAMRAAAATGKYGEARMIDVRHKPIPFK